MPCKLDCYRSYEGAFRDKVSALYRVGIDGSRGPFVRFSMVRPDESIRIAKRLTELATKTNGNVSLNLGFENQQVAELKEWWFETPRTN